MGTLRLASTPAHIGTCALALEFLGVVDGLFVERVSVSGSRWRLWGVTNMGGAMRRLSMGLGVAVLAAACGGGEDPAQPVAVGTPLDDFVCEERVSFHGDPEEGFVGEDTPEEAIAGTPAEYGTPTRASEDGSMWVIFDDQGQLVGKIAVVAAPGGGFMRGEHELCAELDAEGEQGRAQEEEASASNTSGFLLVVLRPDTPVAQAKLVTETALGIPGVFGESYEEGMGLDGAFENLDADIEHSRPDLYACLYPTRVIVVLSDSGPSSQAVADAVEELPGVLGFIGGGFDLTRSLDELSESCA